MRSRISLKLINLQAACDNSIGAFCPSIRSTLGGGPATLAYDRLWEFVSSTETLVE